jgi:hypothetical protein
MEKPRVELIDPEFILAMGRVLSVGAKKHGEKSFHEGMDWNERIGSLQRHVLAFQNKQDIDEETQECHLINAAANCMMLYHNWLRCKGKDTR